MLAIFWGGAYGWYACPIEGEVYLKVEKRQKKKEEVRVVNRLLQITRFSIPYIRGLKALPTVKSTNACILMQQIEYWMAIKPDGFYKFQSRPFSVQYAYKKGDSWTEELGISEDEFRTAFDQIGVRYCSKSEYDEAKKTGDEFAGRYYCSYFNKVSRLTHYFRNDSLVEAAIDSLIEMQNASSVDGDSSVPELTLSTSRAGETGFIEDGNIGFESSDTTPKTKSETISEREEVNPLSEITNSFGKEVKNEEEETLRMEDGSSPDENPETKLVIPADFSPTWDAKYRAVLNFPNKSVAWTTSKFITYYKTNGLELTIEQWRQKWWDWMLVERETMGNDKLDAEHSEIINRVGDDIFARTADMHDAIFDLDDLGEFLDFDYSNETLADVLEQLYEGDWFGKIGDCYFDNEQRRDRWADFQNEIRIKGMLDEVIDIHSLPNMKASLRSILQRQKGEDSETISVDGGALAI